MKRAQPLRMTEFEGRIAAHINGAGEVMVPATSLLQLTVLAAVEINAHPGDELVLVNGVCIGCRPAVPPEPKPKQLMLPPPENGAHTRSRRRYDRRLNRTADQNVLDVIGAGSLAAREILNRMKLSGRKRKLMNQRINRMVDRTVLTVKRHANAHPQYAVAHASA